MTESNDNLNHRTLLEREGGGEEDIGELNGELKDELIVAGEPPGDNYVFLSHTNEDGAKVEIARPTRWFLEHALQVNAFLDERDMNGGGLTEEELLQHASRCTHALVIITQHFRQRKFCVKELNTFIRRMKDPNDNIQVFPILWKIDRLRGYNESVQSIPWIINREIVSPDAFLLKLLWPKLVSMFGNNGLGINTDNSLEEYLAKYIDETRGNGHAIPSPFEAWRKNYVFKTKVWCYVSISIVLLVVVGLVINFGLRGFFGGSSNSETSAELVPIHPIMTNTFAFTRISEDPVTNTMPPAPTPTAISMTNNTTTPTPSTAIPLGGFCESDNTCSGALVCLGSVCCNECRRILLTRVKTDTDGFLLGSNVEAKFFINSRQVYPESGYVSLESDSIFNFPSSPAYPQFENIAPTSNVVFEIVEVDDAPEVNDWYIATLTPSDWYKEERRDPYEMSARTNVGIWELYFTVETECCIE